MITVLFIESGTLGGGSFESLYLHLKNINRELYNPIVVLLNETKYNSLLKAVNVDVYQIDSFIYSTKYDNLIVKVFRRICSLLHRSNIFNPKFVLSICHFDAIRAAKKIIRSNRVSLIHLNDQVLRDLFGVIISKSEKIPCISHLRSMRSLGMNKSIADYANSNVAAFIANSEMTKKHWIELGIDENKIEVIYNAVELNSNSDNYIYSEYSALKELKLGCIANFEDAKGHEFLIRSYSRLTALSSNYKLFLAGKGSKEKEIKGLVEQLNLSDKVMFLGYVENTYSVLSFIDMLIVPSRNESFGRVILEGMISGKPVIATNVGGIPEIIEDNHNGIIIEYGNSDQFVEAVQRISNNHQLKNRLTGNALKLVKDKFSIEEYVGRIDNIYRRVLSSS